MPTRPTPASADGPPEWATGVPHAFHVNREYTSIEIVPPAVGEPITPDDSVSADSNLERASQSLHVLLVEDSVNDAELIAYELARAGLRASCVRVDTAPDLHAALGRHGWDLILTDYTMPRLTAPAAFKLIREHCPDVPCILVSGTASQDTARAAMKLGLDDFVTKQDLSALGEVAVRVLANAQTHREWRAVPRVRFHGGQELQIMEWSTERAVLEGAPLSPGHTRDALLLAEGDAAPVHLCVVSCEVHALSGSALLYESVVTVLAGGDTDPMTGGSPGRR